MAQRTPTENVALAAHWLTIGERMTVRQMAERLGMTPRGARMLLERVSLALPVTVDEGEDGGGVWRLVCGSDGQFGDDEP